LVGRGTSSCQSSPFRFGLSAAGSAGSAVGLGAAGLSSFASAGFSAFTSSGLEAAAPSSVGVVSALVAFGRRVLGLGAVSGWSVEAASVLLAASPASAAAFLARAGRLAGALSLWPVVSAMSCFAAGSAFGAGSRESETAGWLSVGVFGSLEPEVTSPVEVSAEAGAGLRPRPPRLRPLAGAASLGAPSSGLAFSGGEVLSPPSLVGAEGSAF